MLPGCIWVDSESDMRRTLKPDWHRGLFPKLPSWFITLSYSEGFKRIKDILWNLALLLKNKAKNCICAPQGLAKTSSEPEDNNPQTKRHTHLRQDITLLQGDEENCEVSTWNVDCNSYIWAETWCIGENIFCCIIELIETSCLRPLRILWLCYTESASHFLPHHCWCFVTQHSCVHTSPLKFWNINTQEKEVWGFH